MGAPPGRASQKWLLSTLTTVPTKLVNFKEKNVCFSSGQTKLPVIYGYPIKWVSVDHRVGYHCINKLLFATNFMY